MQLNLFQEDLIEYPDSEYMVCNKCKVKKHTSAYTNASGGNYKHTTCKECSAYHQRVRQDLLATVSLPDPDYKCPICQRSEDELRSRNNPQHRVWCLDHCHTNETFRGWLCHRCNRGLGMMADSTEILQRAMDYLNGQP